MPIFVYGTTTNPEGVTIVDQIRFLYGDDPTDHPNYYNYGTIEVDGGTSGIAFYPTTGNGQSFQTSVVENYGVIRAIGTSQARAFYAPSWSPDVYNAGLIEAIGGNSATGFTSWDLYQILTNDGEIRASASAQAIGVYLPNGGQLFNTGLIFAEAENAIGASIPGADENFLLVNDGDIIGGSVGVSYFALSTIDEAPTLINNGLISGVVAINEVNNFNSPFTQVAIIYNHGTLQGDVFLRGGGDTLINTNLITGIINLGSGNDLYDGSVGLAAEAHGGDGRDNLIGGAGADQLFGDALSDVLNGNGGADIIDGGLGDDHVIGGGGDDDLSGGLGFDTLDYASATQSVIVDLSAGVASGAGADQVDGFEQVRGSAFDDHLTSGISSARDRGELFKPVSMRISEKSTAVSIDQWFDLTDRADVANSTTIPHATVVAESWGTIEYYSFTVSSAGATATFDVDHTYDEDVMLVLSSVTGALATAAVRRQIIRDRWRRDLTEALAHLVVDPKQLSYDGASVVGGWFVV